MQESTRRLLSHFRDDPEGLVKALSKALNLGETSTDLALAYHWDTHLNVSVSELESLVNNGGLSHV
jgi:hypothetical protein